MYELLLRVKSAWMQIRPLLSISDEHISEMEESGRIYLSL
jgi:hypothetical protein